jgi:hypothetical protein
MGGHYWTDRAGELQPAVVGGEFDLVVTLFTLPGHGPSAAVEHVVVELPDGPLAPDQIAAVQQLAIRVSTAARAGVPSSYAATPATTARAWSSARR